MAKGNKPNIILWDLECSNLNADFGFIICAGWKRLGEKKVHVIKNTDFDAFDKDPTNDKHVVEEAYEVLSEADMWVTHYGVRFDVPMLNSRLISYRKNPLPPIPHIDTWRVARYKMKLHSNRLASVSAFLDIEEKTPLKPPIWIKAQSGHRPSINYIVKHCRQDVIVLEQAYERIKPLITTHPNVNLIKEQLEGCPVCGGKIQKRGFTIARTRKYQRFSCTKCGAWSRASRAEENRVTVR